MSEKMTSQNELTEIKLVPYNKPHKIKFMGHVRTPRIELIEFRPE
jgi:hypothetical protein